MKEFKKIMVPVDGSKLSEMAFEKAMSLSEMVGSNIDVVYVTDYPVTGPVGMEQPRELEPGDNAESILMPFKVKADENGIEISADVHHGIPSERIIEMSREYDLIIMGTRGMNPITSLVIGSVAEKVARNSCCPVMLIREKDDDCKK